MAVWCVDLETAPAMARIVRNKNLDGLSDRKCVLPPSDFEFENTKELKRESNSFFLALAGRRETWRKTWIPRLHPSAAHKKAAFD